MLSLTSCEILDELNKLGLNAPSDLINYMTDYTDYLSVRNSDPDIMSR